MNLRHVTLGPSGSEQFKKGGAETRRPLIFAAFAALLAVSLAACTRGSQQQPQPQDARAALVQRGRTAYFTYCAACHNSDPSRDGSIGPAVQGSSLELLQARILRAEYPPGYTPKRPSHQMAPLPHLKDQIEAIHAFLNP